MGKTLLGVRDKFALKESEDLVVVGLLQGTVRVGDALYLTNCGEDEEELFLTTVLAIELGPSKPAKEATDCHVALRLEKGTHFKMKKGTVAFSRECTIGEVRGEYTRTLGDVFVAQKNLDIEEKDLELLSMADCAEIWRLFVWFKSQVVKEENEEKKQADREKLNRLCACLCKKILNAEAVYCVFNKKTGEPHMFSQTVRRDDGSYMCTPPQITIGSKAYADIMKPKLSEEHYEIQKIENGPDKMGIYNFLGSTFYLNGACEVAVESNQAVIAANALVPPPDYSNVPLQNIPVTNPDVVRWMLLIGQMGKPETEDAKTVYGLYYKFMSLEMPKAKMLIPMQHEGEVPTPDENGKAVLEKGMSMKFPTMDGKNGRQAVRMFTDWKRLRMVYGEEWGGMVQPVNGMIEVFDCAINATQYPEAGCYISKEMYEEMEKMASAH